MNKIKAIKRELIIAIVSTVAMYLFADVFVITAKKTFEDSYTAALLGSLLATVASGIVMIIMYKLMKPVKIRVLEEDVSPKLLFSGFIGLFCSASILSWVAMIVECFVKKDYLTTGNMEQDYSILTMEQKILFAIASVIVAPIVEELIFRGILFGGMRKVFSFTISVLVSSICFGMLHGNSLLTIASATCAGIVLAWVYAAQNDIMNNIVLHGAYNGFATFIAFGTSAESSEAASQLNDIGIILMPAIFMIFLYGLIFWLCAKCVIKMIKAQEGGIEVENEQS